MTVNRIKTKVVPHVCAIGDLLHSSLESGVSRAQRWSGAPEVYGLDGFCRATIYPAAGLGRGAEELGRVLDRIGVGSGRGDANKELRTQGIITPVLETASKAVTDVLKAVCGAVGSLVGVVIGTAASPLKVHSSDVPTPYRAMREWRQTGRKLGSWVGRLAYAATEILVQVARLLTGIAKGALVSVLFSVGILVGLPYAAGRACLSFGKKEVPDA